MFLDKSFWEICQRACTRNSWTFYNTKCCFCVLITEHLLFNHFGTRCYWKHIGSLQGVSSNSESSLVVTNLFLLQSHIICASVTMTLNIFHSSPENPNEDTVLITLHEFDYTLRTKANFWRSVFS